ncbi:OsmC family protein [Aneurinibacillus sp. Ricciae_BoGa-3]|uniref:OsmC family protein n=1 Tax=Aneurinibacillus sp. Ricciae_BoGa-3 TaxID=3022697 RepID=UPI00233FE472|nr:OsmC family protein [Aneurinibacillus sp. Ricciae_BoGa-3]WCK55555.1 OsmC family protein [Aneurinibacillus sp. Ricciae_BoGa-3]
MAQHSFRLTADWQGGRNGKGSISIGNLASQISAPEELDGPGVGTNPEELLIGAASTCYLITLAAVLERRDVTIRSLTLETEGFVGDEGGLHFERIIHRPRLILAAGSTDEQLKTAVAAAERAEKACMVSKALHGNVSVTVEPDVSVE